MLVNEIYIGNMVQGKYGSISYKTKQNKPRPKSEWYVVKGTHEPIINQNLWNNVQNLIAQKAKPFSIGTIGIFARKARCANCGYIMRSAKNKGKHYLKCPNHHVAENACIGSFISVDRLERLVINELNNMISEYLDKDELEDIQDNYRDLGSLLSAAKTAIKENDDLSDKEADKLKKIIGKLSDDLEEVKVTKGYEIDVKIKIKGKEDDDESELEDIKVIKVNGEWMIDYMSIPGFSNIAGMMGGSMGSFDSIGDLLD